MEPLAVRVVRRFTASADHICWYRVSINKSTARSLSVMVTAGWKPTPSTPRTTRGERQHVWEYYVFPEGFFEQVKQGCREAIQKAKALVEPLGLQLRQARMDPDFEKWATKTVPAVGEYVNFFWLAVGIPFAPGQKKLAERIGNEVAKLSHEFSGVMSIELERE